MLIYTLRRLSLLFLTLLILSLLAYGMDRHINTYPSSDLFNGYIEFMSHFLTGKWGISSVTGEPVLDSVLSYLPATLGLSLAGIIIATIIKERATIGDAFVAVGPAALCFNLASMTLGYGLPRLLRLDKRQSIAIGMEIGIHNGTLAIAIASTPTLLNNSTMAIPPAIYSLIMFFTAGLFGYLVSRGRADRR